MTKEILTPEILAKTHYLEYPGKGEVTQEVRQRAKDLIKIHFSQGIIQGSTIPDYVREHFPGFPVTTINGLIIETIPEINQIQVSEARFKFDGMYQDIIDKMNKVSNNGYFEKDSEQIYCLKNTAEVIDKYMTFLERWGIKDKIPEVHKIDDGNLPVDVMRKIYEERKNGK